MGWVVALVITYFRVVFAGAAYLDRRREQSGKRKTGYHPPKLELAAKDYKVQKPLPLTTQIGLGLLHRDAGALDLFVAQDELPLGAAFLLVRLFLRYVSHHNFTVFAWYRIVFGLLVLVYAW